MSFRWLRLFGINAQSFGSPPTPLYPTPSFSPKWHPGAELVWNLLLRGCRWEVGCSGPLMDAAAQWLPGLLPRQVITGPSSHVDFMRMLIFKIHKSGIGFNQLWSSCTLVPLCSDSRLCWSTLGSIACCPETWGRNQEHHLRPFPPLVTHYQFWALSTEA